MTGAVYVLTDPDTGAPLPDVFQPSGEIGRAVMDVFLEPESLVGHAILIRLARLQFQWVTVYSEAPRIQR